MLTAIFNDLSVFSIIGYGLLAVGVIVTAFSSQRHLLLYTLAGMGYWLLIEVLQTNLVESFPLSNWNGYVIAMMISWVPLAAWGIYRSLSSTARQQKEQELAKAKYIEHTPVYKDYQPRFR